MIPRHVRDQLQSTNEPSSIERVEPTLTEPAVELAQGSHKTEANKTEGKN